MEAVAQHNVTWSGHAALGPGQSRKLVDVQLDGEPVRLEVQLEDPQSAGIVFDVEHGIGDELVTDTGIAAGPYSFGCDTLRITARNPLSEGEPQLCRARAWRLAS